MRCKAMLEKVASDNNKIARRVVGDKGCAVFVWCFKAEQLYPLVATSLVLRPMRRLDKKSQAPNRYCLSQI